MSAEELVARHQPTLDTALTAIRTREYFSAYPESPSPRVYGETAAPAGQAAFDAWLGQDFPLGNTRRRRPDRDRAQPIRPGPGSAVSAHHSRRVGRSPQLGSGRDAVLA